MELTVGIICSCIPVILILYKRIAMKMYNTVHSITHAGASRSPSDDGPISGPEDGRMVSSLPRKLPAIFVGRGNLRTLRSYLGMGNATEIDSSTNGRTELTNTSVNNNADLYHDYMDMERQERKSSQEASISC